MTSFKLLKYTPRIKKKKSGPKKLRRKVYQPIVYLSTRVFKARKHIHMSVFKVQRVMDEICWCYYEETVMILNLMPYRASYPILKLVYSAAANATHYKDFDKANLFITKAEVNRSTIMNKFRPQARGRSSPINKTMCHITILLNIVRA
ncbi:Os12g0488300 [Oryza sativa Japonica Group]|uniref:Large ribosomal subunit protein uL22c n=2 Tax=Oryza sativa subsp. japonica TaxID=39947 RepID=A0A0P0YAA5_ORYSJ|nr:Os12g0488300 [Oryza sativa Japonica Group]